jgi:hypothetical protein
MEEGVIEKFEMKNSFQENLFLFLKCHESNQADMKKYKFSLHHDQKSIKSVNIYIYV